MVMLDWTMSVIAFINCSRIVGLLEQLYLVFLPKLQLRRYILIFAHLLMSQYFRSRQEVLLVDATHFIHLLNQDTMHEKNDHIDFIYFWHAGYNPGWFVTCRENIEYVCDGLQIKSSPFSLSLCVHSSIQFELHIRIILNL